MTDAPECFQPESWQPMATAPTDGDFYLYGLHVNHRSGRSWFEVHYLAWDDGGDMIEASGDIFTDWGHSDFEFWAKAPPLSRPNHGDAT